MGHLAAHTNDYDAKEEYHNRHTLLAFAQSSVPLPCYFLPSVFLIYQCCRIPMSEYHVVFFIFSPFNFLENHHSAFSRRLLYK